MKSHSLISSVFPDSVRETRRATGNAKPYCERSYSGSGSPPREKVVDEHAAGCASEGKAVNS